MKAKQTKSNALKKESIIEALEQTLGVVTPACKRVGINRSTFYDWMKKDEDFAKKVNDISNIALDFGESQLYQLIKDGNVAAIIFFMKTKGKERGYTERREISGPDGGPISAQIQQLTDDIFAPTDDEGV